MIGTKKLVNEYFPKLGELPQKAIDALLEVANDGKLLYSPHLKSGSNNGGTYYCLKCKSTGELPKGVFACPNCGNNDVRAYSSRKYESRKRGDIRFVQQIEDMIILRDFNWCVIENEVEGPHADISEYSRFFIKENEYVVFESSTSYRNRNYETLWQRKKKNFGIHRSYAVIYENNSVKDNAVLVGISDVIENTSFLIAQKLNLTNAIEREDVMEFPDVEFPDCDYSIIESMGICNAIVKHTPIEEAEGFNKVHCWCSMCGKFYEYVKEGDSYNYSQNHCPHCGNLDYVSKKYFNIIIDAVDAENYVLLKIRGVRKYNRLCGELQIGIDPQTEISFEPQYTEYVLLSPDGSIKMFDEHKNEIKKMHTPKENSRWEKITVYYTDKAKSIIKDNKIMKRTGYAEMLDVWHTPRYFEILKGMPALEILSKMKVFTLVQDFLGMELEDIPLYLRKGGKECRLSTLTRPQINSLRKSQVKFKSLITYLRILNKDPNVLYEDFLNISNRSHERHVADIMNVGIPGMTVAKITDYITRVDDAQCCPPTESMQLWSDYLRMLKTLEADLTDNKLVFPNSLKREHDKASRKVMQINNAKTVEKFAEKAAENEWLQYNGKKLTAIIPKQVTELYEEGRKLHHCVGSYVSYVADGTSIIALVRKNNAINEPYCTVEIRDKKIVQVKGISNVSGFNLSGVTGFIKEWSAAKGLTVDAA